MHAYAWFNAIFPFYIALAWVIRVVMVPTVLRRQFTPGASIAWLGIIFLHPYVGGLLYLLVGENRLGAGREALHQKLLTRYRGEDQTMHLSDVMDNGPEDDWKPLAVQARKVGRMSVAEGEVEFITDWKALVDKLIADIDGARSSVHLLYYLWSPDETGQRVARAVIAAAQRGVSCRVLADAFASRDIFRSGSIADQLKQQGVKVAQAMPSSLWRRRDLRNHRKLAVIDGAVAYAGSQNLINADYGGRRGAPWHDLTGRFTGPVVEQFAAVFAEDWAFETQELLEAPARSPLLRVTPEARMQIVPTGPVEPGESYRRVILAAIQSARSRIVITTPYFVPDDPTLVSLMMAADRGVEVTLILPQTPDQIMAGAAGRAHYSSLLDAGVSIHLYQPGLIHSKTATVDETVALFGSANLDIRSFHLNFEISVLAYGKDITLRLRQEQMRYVEQSSPIDPSQWARRSTLARYFDSVVSLISPLL